MHCYFFDQLDIYWTPEYGDPYESIYLLALNCPLRPCLTESVKRVLSSQKSVLSFQDLWEENTLFWEDNTLSEELIFLSGPLRGQYTFLRGQYAICICTAVYVYLSMTMCLCPSVYILCPSEADDSVLYTQWHVILTEAYSSMKR